MVFTTAVIVRLAFFAKFLANNPPQKIWETGFEASRIASSLAAGQGFSSPFGFSTGASAWIPPGYAGILAIIFKIFGTCTRPAAWSALTLNAVLAALTACAIYEAGEKILGKNLGVIAAWIWVFSPQAVAMSIKIWETTLTALLIMTGSLLYWRIRGSTDLRRWLLWGFFWGCAILVNPTLGIFFAILTLGSIWKNRRQMMMRLVLAAFISCVIVGPWIARNYIRFGTFVPVRSNFGVELWLGNHDGVSGPNDETRHPLGDRRELAAYREMGEPNYVAAKKRAAITFITSHPGTFLLLTLWRVAFFWSSPSAVVWIPISILSFAGLVIAMRRDFLQSLPFATALLIYPGVYYLTHADDWYRHPIEPVMILMFVYSIRCILSNCLRGSG